MKATTKRNCLGRGREGMPAESQRGTSEIQWDRDAAKSQRGTSEIQWDRDAGRESERYQ